MQQLCIILDSRKALWSSLGCAYGVTDDQLKYFYTHKTPEEYPATRQLLQHMKDKTSGKDDEKTIYRLLAVLHARIPRPGKENTYEGADKLYDKIKHWHVGCGCQVCCTF